MMVEAGHMQGSYSTLVFYHKEKNNRPVVRGDDFTVPGSRVELDWLREVTQRHTDMKFKSRLQRRRPGAVKIVYRIATVANGVLEYEGSNGEGGQDVKGDKSESEFRAVAARENY
jgi:hypothetical protein